MIDTPHILDMPARKVAKIHLAIPTSEMMTHMGPGIMEVRKVIAEQRIAAAGAWLTHHYKIPDQTFDFDICVPVDSDVTPQGRVEPGELRAAKVARTVYRGDYSGLPGGWGEFLGWFRAQGLTMAGDFWEVYSVGPDGSANPAEWQTELNIPLA